MSSEGMTKESATETKIWVTPREISRYSEECEKPPEMEGPHCEVRMLVNPPCCKVSWEACWTLFPGDERDACISHEYCFCTARAWGSNPLAQRDDTSRQNPAYSLLVSNEQLPYDLGDDPCVGILNFFFMIYMAKAKKPVIPESDNRDQAFEAAIEQIKKAYGDGSIMNMAQAQNNQIERISTGSISLDIALGGGIPKGRIIEIYGPESSGKTTLTLHVATECQKEGGRVAFIDAEHALDPTYAQKIGLDLASLTISQPDSGEEALEITEMLVRSGGVDLIIVDSVAALTPKAEIDGMMGEAQVGLQARLMSQALRKLTALVSKSNCSVIFINQLRMKIGVMFGSPETTTGGNALKFYSSVRMDIRRIAKIESGTGDDKLAVGNRVRVKIVKNKVSPPFRQAEFDVLFNKGIGREGDVIDMAVKYEIMKKSGAFYSYQEEKLGQGRAKVIDLLGEKTELYDELFQKVKQAYAQEQGNAMPVQENDEESSSEEERETQES